MHFVQYIHQLFSDVCILAESETNIRSKFNTDTNTDTDTDAAVCVFLEFTLVKNTVFEPGMHFVQYIHQLFSDFCILAESETNI